MALPNSANVVVLASNYNPSIVSKEWLYQKGIFTEAIRNFVHTPVFSLVESDRFSISVDEGRFQVTARKVTQDTLNILPHIAARFVEVLPETPYKAVGVNYQYDVVREEYDLEAILSPNQEKLGKLLSTDYALGATFKFEFGEFIVTFTILPSFHEEHQIGMGFNFHSDTTNVDEVKERLSSQTRIIEKAETIIGGLSKNG